MIAANHQEFPLKVEKVNFLNLQKDENNEIFNSEGANIKNAQEMKLLDPNDSSLKRRRKNNEERILSLKRASFEQFQKIHNQVKAIHNSCKYNNKLINEIKLEKDRIESLLKNHEKVVKGLIEQVNSFKEKITEIDESYSHFNKHKKNLNLNLISKPIKYAEGIKTQLSNDIEKIHLEIKDELKQKLKRIVLCETSIKRISKDFNDFLARFSNSGDIK